MGLIAAQTFSHYTQEPDVSRCYCFLTSVNRALVSKMGAYLYSLKRNQRI